VDGVEESGKTVDEAIEKALEKLGLDESEVEVEVLSMGRSGILGIGGDRARVLVRPKGGAAAPASGAAAPASGATAPAPGVAAPTEEDLETAVGVLEHLLELMNVDASVQVRAPETPGDGLGLVRAVMDVSGEDLGILIGRRGETLSSLQFLVNLVVSRKLKARTAFGIDIEGYRRRREEALKGLALRMADRVKSTGQSITLEPMPPNERRIVHLALAKDPNVITVSIGEGENRKVAITPRR
jgi:spoIIIJ-associated protein